MEILPDHFSFIYIFWKRLILARHLWKKCFGVLAIKKKHFKISHFLTVHHNLPSSTLHNSDGHFVVEIRNHSCAGIWEWNHKPTNRRQYFPHFRPKLWNISHWECAHYPMRLLEHSKYKAHYDLTYNTIQNKQLKFHMRIQSLRQLLDKCFSVPLTGSQGQTTLVGKQAQDVKIPTSSENTNVPARLAATIFASDKQLCFLSHFFDLNSQK